MRYLVRYWDGKNIINDIHTNNFSEVIERSKILKESYEDVWYADTIEEILVG